MCNANEEAAVTLCNATEEANLAACGVAANAEQFAAVRSAGYRYVTLDLEGFRSGNLNGALS